MIGYLDFISTVLILMQCQQTDTHLIKELLLINVLLLNTAFKVKLLEKAISIAPESFDVLYGVGTAYRFARKPLLAVGMYEKALNIAPLAPTDTKLNYLRALIDSKKFSKAESVSKEMMGSDKHSSYWGYLFLIYIKFENGQKDEAVRLYQEFSKMKQISLDEIISEIKSYPWSWDVWYKITLVDTLREIDKL